MPPKLVSKELTKCLICTTEPLAKEKPDKAEEIQSGARLSIKFSTPSYSKFT